MKITRRGLLESLALLPIVGRFVTPLLKPTPPPLESPASYSTTLAAEAARIWRAWNPRNDANLGGFQGAMRSLVEAEWRRRCRAAKITLLHDLSIRAMHDLLNDGHTAGDMVMTPSYQLDVDEWPPSADVMFGRQVEMAMTDLVHACRNMAGVGGVLFHGERRAYKFDHFLHVIAYRAIG